MQTPPTTQKASAEPEIRGHVTPEAGDLLCIRQGAFGWAYSGDRFSHFADGMIVAKQTYSSGAVRFTRGDERAFRVLRGQQLFHITMPAR